ncbi:MAG: ATP-binding cassette domain-containing protein [Treponema sp.]|jgi:simple sugar transport system ATP-binding protein|nr:ATP-binding cassette domain-containing protein [Treponema sp.]
MSGGYAAELRGISKTYSGSGTRANHNISLGLRKGEILCIAGENGAGKTTLMKILCGLETPDTGEIYINGKAVTIDSPITARRLGLGMVHQHFMLFPEYTVAENIVMGIEPRKWGIFFDRAQAQAAATQVIEAHHFSVDPAIPVHTLSIGEMQQVEICRLLHRNADIIILDEPSSALTEHETAALFKTLKTLAQAGKSLILITHKLREIKLISDRVAVLRQGELVGIRDTAEIDEHEISRMMIGATSELIISSNGLIKKNSEKESEPVIVFDNVTIRRRGQKRPLLDRLSFTVRSGEILGFAGVGGNGLGVLEAALGGFLHPAAGAILHRGRDISRLNIRRLRNQGLAYVPADRLRVGSAPEATVDENIIIDRRHELTRMGFLDRGAIQTFAADLIKRHNVAGAAEAKQAASLSGGNLQKLILAREIDKFRDYIVFSEPSWGLDIAASNFVWGEIAALREKGAAIILISTNLDEILSLADRIIVMYRGKAAGEFSNTEATGADSASIKEKIGACMQGLSPGGTAQ